MMFDEIPFYDRFNAVKLSGYDDVEFWKWSNRDVERIKKILNGINLNVVLMNVDSSNKKVSDNLWRGVTSCDRPEDFIEALKQTVEISDQIGVKKLVVLPGDLKQGSSIEKQQENLLNILYKAATIAEENDLTIVLEPLDKKCRPQSILSKSEDGFNIIKKIDSPSLKLLYDLYHQQISEGNLIETITENIDLIGHIHIADVPGRHEPGSGEINFNNVITTLDTIGYNEPVGLEYLPTIHTKDSLKLIKNYLGGTQNE